jgi:hypothetical protein
MHLTWNPSLRRFEAQFTDFAVDQPLVKKAGFKTDGPPSWVWWTAKASPLVKLKGTPNLTIAKDARVEFDALNAREQQAAEIKKKAKDAQKALKKKLENDRREETCEVMFNGKAYIDTEDLPPMPPLANPYISPPPPTETCFICAVPVYPYEYAEGSTPSCLWCQKLGELYR